MEDDPGVVRLLSFGDFTFDQERRQLLRSGEPVPLETKAYELLALLLSRRPNALSKAQIRDVLWPGTSVSESALARLVTQLRAACGDDAQTPRFIRTVHGFGYAFCGEAREPGDGPGHVDATPAPTSPYPGLSPFEEADADRFFGREVEVEVLWGKIRRQTLLAVIGPSGVGKTSLLRAGLIPHRPSGWAALACTPGEHPFVALGQDLAPVLAADSEAMAELLRGSERRRPGEEPDGLVSALSRWRRGHAEALLVVDQFEELFTLNVPEVQAVSPALLGRLVDESGLRVVLGLRDDFFMRCGEHPALAPVFDPSRRFFRRRRRASQRALREPPARHGVRFEDESLIEEMTAAVSAERGALPLLAFAASRLWEERDRERRLLTREAYERIGGMAGALAQHAEATLQRLGPEREPIVRELFRNLVTAEGTRASRARVELLSVFGPRRLRRPRSVLDALVASRLLTAYDAPERGLAGATSEMPVSSTQRIEIVHESLLTHWPRLVRWQTQDADGAQLRDQLRQAAPLWDERGRRPDLLWTGASYVDYLAWRSRYPGHLSSLEEDFVQAMSGLANRRRRRRRIAVAVGRGRDGSRPWRVGDVLEPQRERAPEGGRRSPAARRPASCSPLGQAELERHPTAALAYAIKSLELADTEEARRFALRVLQAAPTAFPLPTLRPGDSDHNSGFQPGRGMAGPERLPDGPAPRMDGRKPIVVADDFPSTGWIGVGAEFGRDGDVLVGGGVGDVRTWSVPEGRELRRLKVEGGDDQWLYVRGDQFFMLHDRGRDGKSFEGLRSPAGVPNSSARWWPCPSRPSTLRAPGSPTPSGATSICARWTTGPPRRGSSAHIRPKSLPSRSIPTAGSSRPATRAERYGSGRPRADPRGPCASSTARERGTSATAPEVDGSAPSETSTDSSRGSGTFERRAWAEPVAASQRFPCPEWIRLRSGGTMAGHRTPRRAVASRGNLPSVPEETRGVGERRRVLSGWFQRSCPPPGTARSARGRCLPTGPTANESS